MHKVFSFHIQKMEIILKKKKKKKKRR